MQASLISGSDQQLFSFSFLLQLFLHQEKILFQATLLECQKLSKVQDPPTMQQMIESAITGNYVNWIKFSQDVSPAFFLYQTANFIDLIVYKNSNFLLPEFKKELQQHQSSNKLGPCGIKQLIILNVGYSFSLMRMCVICLNKLHKNFIVFFIS